MTEDQTPTFELLWFDHGTAIVAMRTARALSAMHDHPIPERAARWMLRDLEANPDEFRGTGHDFGPLYVKATEILSLLDFNRSPEENAKELALALVHFNAPEIGADDTEEIPF